MKPEWVLLKLIEDRKKTFVWFLLALDLTAGSSWNNAYHFLLSTDILYVISMP